MSGFWTFSLSTIFPEIPSLRSYSLTSEEEEEEEETGIANELQCNISMA
jgi:hypothetical protein